MSLPRQIAAAAVAALKAELATYPKPGLVSFVDHGSHPDMDAALFLRSADALEDYFAAAASAGRAGCGFAELRVLGLEAERRMFAATGGRNTHKGAVFTLGLLAAAAGRGGDDLGLTVKEAWGAGILAAGEDGGDTHGQLIRRRFGLGGAREEAAGGFRHVFEVGVPAYRSIVGQDVNAARVQVFFALLEKVGDTTLVHRGGLEGLELARRLAGDFNRVGGVMAPGWFGRAREIHAEFVRRNLSSGGVADLLAATLFAVAKPSDGAIVGA